MKRSIRHSRQRGAALVEAALVMPVICTFLGMMIWFHSLYKTKQTVMLNTRGNVLSAASHGCKGGSDDVLPTNNPGDSKSQGAIAKGNMSSQTSFIFKMEKSDNQATAKGKGGTTGGWSRVIKAHSACYCNEIPQDGNLSGLFQFGMQQFKSMRP